MFLNRPRVGAVHSRSGQFSAAINLHNLPAGTDRVKVTVITTTGAIIAETRTSPATSDSRSTARRACDEARRVLAPSLRRTTAQICPRTASPVPVL